MQIVSKALRLNGETLIGTGCEYHSDVCAHFNLTEDEMMAAEYGYTDALGSFYAWHEARGYGEAADAIRNFLRSIGE